MPDMVKCFVSTCGHKEDLLKNEDYSEGLKLGPRWFYRCTKCSGQNLINDARARHRIETAEK